MEVLGMMVESYASRWSRRPRFWFFTPRAFGKPKMLPRKLSIFVRVSRIDDIEKDDTLTSEPQQSNPVFFVPIASESDTECSGHQYTNPHHKNAL